MVVQPIFCGGPIGFAGLPYVSRECRALRCEDSRSSPAVERQIIKPLGAPGPQSACVRGSQPEITLSTTRHNCLMGSVTPHIRPCSVHHAHTVLRCWRRPNLGLDAAARERRSSRCRMCVRSPHGRVGGDRAPRPVDLLADDEIPPCLAKARTNVPNASSYSLRAAYRGAMAEGRQLIFLEPRNRCKVAEALVQEYSVSAKTGRLGKFVRAGPRATSPRISPALLLCP